MRDWMPCLVKNGSEKTMAHRFCTQLVLVAVTLCLCGCGSKSDVNSADSTNSVEKTEIKVDGPLRILVLDDVKLGEILEREWRASSEHRVEVTYIETASLLSQLDEGLKKLDTDVVVFPSSMLGQLVEQKLLRPLPRELVNEPSYRNAEVFDLVRRRETLWGKQTYAVSFGSPTMVLFRRTDLVPSAPNTWTELNQEVERLRKESLPEGIVPLAQPLARGWAAHMLLARSAAYLYDSSRVSSVFDYSTMEPRIASPPFVRALEEMAASHTSSSKVDLTPATVLDEFLSGRAAMAITWPSASSTRESDEQVTIPIAISGLPGADTGAQSSDNVRADVGEGEADRVTLFGISGRLGAVSRSAKNASLANIFLAWATGPEQSANICPRSNFTAPFRDSHHASAAMWIHPQLPNDLADDYVTIVQSSLCRAQAFQSPRLPGQHRYMSALDEGILRALQKEQTAQRALSAIVDAWNSTTIYLDKLRQIAAYRRSLGIDTD